MPPPYKKSHRRVYTPWPVALKKAVKISFLIEAILFVLLLTGWYLTKDLGEGYWVLKGVALLAMLPHLPGIATIGWLGVSLVHMTFPWWFVLFASNFLFYFFAFILIFRVLPAKAWTNKA